eukprot:gene4942-5740_t
MYDPNYGSFSIRNATEATDPYWWWGTPIWTLAMQNQMETACFFWPGCAAKIQGLPPTYPEDLTYKNLPASTVLGYVYGMQTNQKPQLTMAYLVDVDDAGHKYGPDSPQVNSAIQQVDAAFGTLIQGLEEKNLLNTTNILIVSDHGMATVTEKIDISRFIDITKIKIIDYSPVLSIFPIDGGLTLQEIYKQLAGKDENLQIYMKQDIPASLYFNSPSNIRIPPLIGIASLGYEVVSSASKPSYDVGAHGYNNTLMPMKGIFISHGPNLKKVTDDFNFANIDIFSLYTKLLNISNVPSTNATSYLVDLLYQQV